MTRFILHSRVNIKFLCIALVVFGVLTYISFLGAFSYDDGHRGSIDEVLYDLFLVMRFPTHTLLWGFISKDSVMALAFPVGLIVNVFFYALVSERIFSLFIRKKRFNANQ
jgi:hypothetical protein